MRKNHHKSVMVGLFHRDEYDDDELIVDGEVLDADG